MAENDRVTRTQEAFITAYLAAGSVPVAALTCRVAERTAYRWLKLSHVKQALKAAQKELFEQELSELRRIVGKAIRCLDRNMEGDDVRIPPSTQVSAARIVLEQSIQLNKLDDLAREVEELKAVVEEQQQ